DAAATITNGAAENSNDQSGTADSAANSDADATAADASGSSTDSRTATAETDANTGAASGHSSLSRSPAREVRRQKIPHDGQRWRSRTHAVSHLAAKKYRP